MLPIDIRIEKLTEGDYRITQSPTPLNHGGKISETSYPTFEEAYAAAKEGKYD